MKKEAVFIKSNDNKIIRYTVTLLILFIILVCFFSIYFINKAKDNLYSEKLQNLEEISLKSADLIKSRVDDRLNTLNVISKQLSLKDNYILNEYLSALEKQNQDEFKKIGIISLNGNAVTTDGFTYNLSNNKYFKNTLKGQTNVSDLIVDSDNKDVNIFMLPIKYKGKINCVLFGTQNTSQFSDILPINSFNGEAYSYVVNNDGAPVIHSYHKNSIGKYSNLFNTLQNSQENKNFLNKLKSDLKNNISSSFKYKINNLTRYGSYNLIGFNDWYIISVVPENILLKSSYKLISTIILTALILILSVIGFSIIIVVFLKKNNKYLQQIAYKDNLTGYSNWNKFEIDCTQLLKQNQNTKYAMITFDIDRFKVINDIYGHIRGNEILKYIADVLMQTTNNIETFSRFSGDNYNILMSYEDELDIISKIDKINNQVTSKIKNYNIKLYFGIYEIRKGISNINSLIDRANLAKLSVKGQAENYYSFFSEEIRKSILFENEIENCMEWALKDNEFEMFLQPKFLFETGKIVGAEALVRWNKDGGMIHPNSFIPLFEKNGFVRKLDKYMFEKVCVLLSQWKNNNSIVTPISISVNFSRIDLTNTMLPNDLVNIAKKHDVDPTWIEIEITESAVFNNTNQLIRIMQELKDAGFKISIDDFGSGYSSLNILKDLPANVIKMDKEFLDETTHNEKGKLIIASLIKMSRGLGLCTVAEGVETINQVNFLKENGCDIAQGFYYAKPMPVSEFEKLLNTHL